MRNEKKLQTVKALTSILKRDGRKEPYDRGKITMATWQSLWAVQDVRKKYPEIVDVDEIARRAADIEVSHEKADRTSALWKEADRLSRIVEDALVRSNGSHRWTVEEIQDIREQTLLVAGREAEAKAYIFYRNKKQEARNKKQALQAVTNDLGMPPNAFAAMARRYLWKDKEGNVVETPREAMMRVASAVAAAESQKSKVKSQDYKLKVKIPANSEKYWRDQYLEIMTRFEFVPAGCYFRGAGNTQNGSLANCFVLPVEDSIEQIFDAVKWSALIHQMGGGTGFNFSHLRPRGDVIGSGGLASGPINFMKAFDAETQIVMQGGEHRGANMGILNVDHPDIFEFIRAKSVDGEVSNFNVSVGAFGKFMEAVEKDREWSLVNPRDKATVQKIPARQLWSEIIRIAHATGDPGMIYLDAINRTNPVMKYLGPIESTNVCVVGSTIIQTENGGFTIQNIVQNRLDVKVQTGTGKFERVTGYWNRGKKQVVELSSQGGLKILATADHQFLTPNGFVELSKLQPDNQIVTYQSRRPAEDMIVSISPVGEEQTFDLTVEPSHQMVTNGFVTHNCGEQPLHPFDVCFAEETRILTSRGYEAVADVCQRQELGHQILIATHLNGRENEIILRPARVIKTGRKKTVRVTLWNGQQIRVTPNHEVYTREGWKKAEKLTDEDYVMIQRYMGGELIFDTPKVDLQRHHLFGWFSGDGWFTDGSCGLTFGPQDTFAFDYLCPLWQEFSEYQHRVNVQKNFVRCLASQKRAVMEKFRNFGFAPAKAFDKRVPSSVMTASKHQQIAYLQGLFAADGSVVHNKPAVTLTSASYALLRDVQLLLLDLGIHSHIRHYYGERPTGRAWAILQVSGESFRRFMDLIGFPLTPYKQEKAESHFSRRIYANRQFIQVRRVEIVGVVDVYDVSEPETNSLIAEGMVVHNCNLGSINLSKFVVKPWWEEISNLQLKSQNFQTNIKWKRIEEVVRIAVRFLDDGIDASTYPISQIDEMAHKLRRIGLGVMGWADMLVKLGIPYNSDEGIHFAEKIMKFIQDISWDESEKIASEKGVFPFWEDSYFNGRNNPFGRRRKVRNVAVTTIAPTGTISMIADCSSGIEPYFALEYTKNVVARGGLRYVNQHYQAAQRELKTQKYNSKLKSTIQNSKLDEIFRTAHEIDPEWHARMQAAFQKYTDNAVSKTINFPRSATVKDVERAYMLAWKLGCKGITVYRDGSREGQILRTKEQPQHDVFLLLPPRRDVRKGARAGFGRDSRFSKDENLVSSEKKPRLMQSQLQITPLSQRAYQVERLELVEGSADGHCPECGAVMEEVEGCLLCRNCGYSRCSL